MAFVDGDEAALGAARAGHDIEPARCLVETRMLPKHLDAKCRQIMGPWAEGAAAEARPGVIRQLETDGATVTYRPGRPDPLGGARDRARLVFIDGGMNRVPPADHEILQIP